MKRFYKVSLVVFGCVSLILNETLAQVPELLGTTKATTGSNNWHNF